MFFFLNTVPMLLDIFNEQATNVQKTHFLEFSKRAVFELLQKTQLTTLRTLSCNLAF